jgi:hypothetical protein
MHDASHDKKIMKRKQGTKLMSVLNQLFHEIVAVYGNFVFQFKTPSISGNYYA